MSIVVQHMYIVYVEVDTDDEDRAEAVAAPATVEFKPTDNPKIIKQCNRYVTSKIQSKEEYTAEYQTDTELLNKM